MPPLMPAAKLRPGRAEHDHAAAGHVLAAVVADALDDRAGAAVAHGEPLAGHAAHERVAAGGAVERDVADDHVLFRRRTRALARRPHDQAAARQALADEVVGLAFERQRDAARQEGAEALPGRAGERRRGWCRRAGRRRRSAW